MEGNDPRCKGIDSLLIEMCKLGVRMRSEVYGSYAVCYHAMRDSACMEA